MSNVLVTPALISKLTLMELGSELVVPSCMTTKYAGEFGNKAYKIGDSLKVRKPQRFEVTESMVYNDSALQNLTTEIKVDKWAQVAFEFDAREKTLSLEAIRERYAQPAARAIAAKINARAAEYVAKNAPFSVGTPATVPTAMSTYLGAGDILYELGLPSNTPLNCIVTRAMSSSLVENMKALTNPGSVIGGQIKGGEVADILGYKWWRDQTLYTHTVSAHGGTPLVNGVPTANTGGNNDTMTLVTDGWTASITLKAGDRFTLDSVYAVHPETRVTTKRLQQFVVLQDCVVDGSGNGSILCAPGLTPSGPYQNVSALPADNAAITMIGTASYQSPVGLLLPKIAFGFMAVPLEVDPELGPKVTTVTDPDTGISLTYTRGFEVKDFKEIHRIDCLYGFGVHYRELACAIYS